MKKEPERKIPYGIYRKGFFILVAGAESEGMAAKVAAIREHLERVGPIRAGVYRMLAVSGPDDAAGEPFLRVVRQALQKRAGRMHAAQPTDARHS